MIKKHIRLILWLPVFIWLEIIFLLSSIPASLLPHMLSDSWLFWAHRIAHICEYSTLGILLIRAYKFERGQMSLKMIIFLMFFILLAGLLDEWHQSFVPGRHAQFIDAYFDTICGTLGMFIYYKWPRKNV